MKSFKPSIHRWSRLTVLTLVLTQCLGCATLSKPRNRTGALVLTGGATGAIGGAVLSPDSENRGLNALVFGLSGALISGVVGMLLEPTAPGDSKHSLKEKELEQSVSLKEYPLYPAKPLPEFVTNRIQPVVIEEYLESDRVTEEGTLHEPHKAYRIKRPAELFASPAVQGASR